MGWKTPPLTLSSVCQHAFYQGQSLLLLLIPMSAVGYLWRQPVAGASSGGGDHLTVPCRDIAWENWGVSHVACTNLLSSMFQIAVTSIISEWPANKGCLQYMSASTISSLTQGTSIQPKTHYHSSIREVCSPSRDLPGPLLGVRTLRLQGRRTPPGRLPGIPTICVKP